MSSSVGSATTPSNNSVQSFVTALVLNSAALGLEVAAFTYLHRSYTRIYSPRAFLPPPSKRSVPLPRGWFRWIPAVITTPSKEMIHKNGLDAYMFVRFLKILIMIFVPFTILTFAVILPVDAVGNPRKGLNSFSTGNVQPNEQSRYYAHVVVAWILTAYVIWLLRREMLRFVHLRHQFLLSKSHSKLAQAKTVLITSLPEKDLTTEADLRTFASFVPGGVAKVWIYRDSPGLNDAYQQRLDACGKLEGAVSTLLRDATKAWRKKQKRDKAAQKVKEVAQDEETAHGSSSNSKAANGTTIPNEKPTNANGTTNGVINGAVNSDPNPRPNLNARASGNVHSNRNSVRASRNFDLESHKSAAPLSILDSVSRPTHRLGWHGVPWVGKKVDTIEWCKEEIPRLTEQINRARMNLPNAKPHGAAMIMCNLQMGAHVLAQCASYHEPFKMVDKWIELAPDDVIWDNIDDAAIATRGRWILSWMATIGLIILWSFPVAFTGTLSNIDQLCGKVYWLHWICTLPKPLPGIIQGILPPLFLAILFLLLPFVLKGLAYFEGIPRWSLISISVYRRYYMLLVIQGFLVVTLSSGLTSALPQIINSPVSVVKGLAQNLPSASVFYLTYLIANGFTAAGTAMLQLLPLVLHYVKRLLFGNTPRQAYNVAFVMPDTNLGTTLPRISLLATIGIAYSVISPIVSAFAAIAFSFLWFAWKFLMTWVMDQPEAQETGGLYFPLAISNLFVGLYVEHLCLAALFFLAVDENGSKSSLPEAILMLVLVGITAIAQVTIRNAFRPITNYLPMSLATKEMVKRYNSRHKAATAVAPRLAIPGIGVDLQQVQNVGADALHQVEEHLDLFSAQHVRSLMRRRFRRRKSSNKPLPENLEEAEQMRESPEASPTLEADDTMVDSTPAGSAGPKPLGRDRASMNSDPAAENERPPSRGSNNTSRGSDVSRHSSMHGEPAKATPGSRKIKPRGTLYDEDDDDAEEDIDEHAFDHPSTYKPAPWIWVPKDELGLSDVIIEELQAAGVEASQEGAKMSAEARVKVTRNPPDQEWIGGNDV